MAFFDQLVGQGLGMIPYAGPIASGAYGGYRSGMGGVESANPFVNRALQDTAKPAELTKKGSAISGAAIGATSLIPVAGPAIAAGLSIANKFRNKKLADKYQKEVEENAMQYGNMAQGNAMSMALQQRQKQMQQRQPMAMARRRPPQGQGQGQQMVAPSTNGMPPTQPQPPSPYPPQDISPNAPPRGVRSNSGIPGQYGSTPYGPQGGMGNRGSFRQPGYTHKPVSPMQSMMNQLMKQHLFYGLDPRILAGQNMAATQAGQDARMNLANNMGRSGDNSGYNTGIGTGIDMGVANQLASIYPQWLQQNQDYTDQLVNMMRGTRKGSTAANMAPGSGGNLAGTIGALGSLASGMGNLMGSFGSNNSASGYPGRQMNFWSQGNVGPVQ